MAGILGKKQGMTKFIAESGIMIPVTVIKVEDNEILHVKTTEKDGKNAIIVGMDPYKKERKSKKYKHIKEFTVPDSSLYTKGQKVSVELLKDIKEVTVSSVTKGKGFQGVMKRWGFHGGPGSHGSHFRREPGSIGGRAQPGKVLKGKKLPGHMGDKRKTLINRPIEYINEQDKTIMIKGPVPGARNTLVEIKF